MTHRQRLLARHALGLPNRANVSYRNRFIAGVGHSDYDDWSEMVANGEAFHRGKDKMFWLSETGAALAVIQEHERLDPEDFPAWRPNKWHLRLLRSEPQ